MAREVLLKGFMLSKASDVQYRVQTAARPATGDDTGLVGHSKQTMKPHSFPAGVGVGGGGGGGGTSDPLQLQRQEAASAFML